MKIIIVLTTLFVAFVFVPGSATIINIPSDYPTIQEGIDASSDGDTVLVQPGTYVENINFNGHNIVLGSLFLTMGDTSYISSTIIDGDNNGVSVVAFESGEDSIAFIIGFTIQNGYTDGYGGGIFCGDNSSPTIMDNIITNNSSHNSGAGICCRNSHPTIINNIISDNSINNVYFGDGGGIYCYCSHSIIKNNTIRGNYCYMSSGGMSCWNSNLTIINNTIVYNSTIGDGGGILLSNSNPAISDNIVSRNSSGGSGGGINCWGSSPIIKSNIISDNSAGYYGGGVYNNNSSSIIANNIINGNTAHCKGGGIHCCYNWTYHIPMIINNTIINNSAIESGGGISCFNECPIIINTINWFNNPPDIYIDTLSSPEIMYSDIQGGWEGEGNINTDPLFRDPENSDFHLMAIECGDPYDSPCIDAGHPDILDSLLDCEWGLGELRSDIGTYAGGDSVPHSGRIINVPNDYPTIQEGINASNDGDTVLVQPGTYVENINFNGHNITLGSLFLTTGDTSYISSTIIDGDSLGTVVTFKNDEDSTAVITGFTITNGYAEYGGGIYCVDNSRPIIVHNVIIRNWAYGEPWSIGYGGGIFCMDSGPLIRNNTVSQNLANWGGGICFWGTAYPIIKNTIFWADSAVMNCNEVFLEDVAWPTITYCDIEDTIWSGDGNINCDPLFCPPDIGNFYLAENSCCVGAGEDGVNIGAFGVGCPAIISCDYIPGDINGDGNVNGSDVTYAVRYFKGLGPPPPDSCWNDFNSSWLYSAGDVNGNCAFTGSDVIFFVCYFRGYNPEILWCPWTPPINPLVQMRKEQ